ncbi:hypothetical protein [Rubrivirga sp. IMCC45206]|uniref:hypothetical protein n=1 Tax=Rubrivirga sp. IMCC45206 TaxID=3391614 RepID=UPI00398FF470
MTSRVLLLAALALAACADPADAPLATASGGGVAARERAPQVVVPTQNGLVDLATLAGHPVVLHFGDGTDGDIAQALADLEAAGATVLVVAAGGEGAEAARAFGYDGAPLAVVVDAEGDVRGRSTATTGDGLFALASPVLAEADISDSVAWGGADTLAQLLASGGVVVDVSETNAGPDVALDLAADTMAASDLPADLGTPLAFVGPDAETAARRAARWGYAAAFIVDEEGALFPVEAPAPRSARRPGGVRG